MNGKLFPIFYINEMLFPGLDRQNEASRNPFNRPDARLYVPLKNNEGCNLSDYSLHCLTPQSLTPTF